MLGRHHLALSVTTMVALSAPFLHSREEFLLTVIVGTTIGSLIPDVDSPDAKIFHKNIVKGNNKTGKLVNLSIGLLVPVFGYTTKYLIYKPVVLLLNVITFGRNFKNTHRGFTHSIIGLIAISTVTATYIKLFLNWLQIIPNNHFKIFMASYVMGALLHVVQDSCTKSGIAWNAPFSKTKVKGKLVTGKDNHKPEILQAILALLLIGTTYSIYVNKIPAEKVIPYSVTALTITWLLFIKVVAGAKIVRK